MDRRQVLLDVARECRVHAQALGINPQTADLRRVLLNASRAMKGEAVGIGRVDYVGETTPGDAVPRPYVWAANGSRRTLTWRERLAVWLLRGATEIRP